MFGSLGGFLGGMDPLDYLIYAVFSGVVCALVGYRWWLIPALIAGLLLWPFALRFLRWAWRRASVGARSSGLVRKPGVLYCAECGGELAPETAGGSFAVSACPSCAGKWCADAELAAGQAKLGRAAASWFAAKDGAKSEDRPCPKCFAAMPRGALRGMRGSVFRCEPCGGLWFDRVDWVSFELG